MSNCEINLCGGNSLLAYNSQTIGRGEEAGGKMRNLRDSYYDPRTPKRPTENVEKPEKVVIYLYKLKGLKKDP